MNTRDNKLTETETNFNQNKWMIENSRIQKLKIEVLPPLDKHYPILKCADCKCNIDTEWEEAVKYCDGHLCTDCEAENANDCAQMFKDQMSDYQGGLT